LDVVTTAIWFVYFDLIILTVLRRIMAFASSNPNNLDSLWQKSVSLESKSFEAASFCFLELNLFYIGNLCIYSLPLSLILAPPYSGQYHSLLP
jgi:hypothetical protein